MVNFLQKSNIIWEQFKIYKIQAFWWLFSPNLLDVRHRFYFSPSL
jgi:hypothetical protein